VHPGGLHGQGRLPAEAAPLCLGVGLIHDLLRRWWIRTALSPVIPASHPSGRPGPPWPSSRDCDHPPRLGLGPHEHWGDFADRWLPGIMVKWHAGAAEYPETSVEEGRGHANSLHGLGDAVAAI
jgi:hypothetical protein